MPLKIIKNPDNVEAEKIRLAVKNNGGYCPCVLLKTEDSKCMCKSFREQQSEGLCHCGLYMKVKTNKEADKNEKNS